jgi:hypothetical protein
VWIGIVIGPVYGKVNHSEAISPMAANTQEATGKDLVEKSTLYREFQAEREEIMRHKWIESEKVGYDIGFEHALTDWIMRHRSKWRRGRQPSDKEKK